MKHFFTAAVFLLHISIVTGQDSIVDIDPRRYVQVYEIRNEKKKIKQPILLWSWEGIEQTLIQKKSKKKEKKSNLTPLDNLPLQNQKRTIVDIGSKIKIQFLKDQISKNTEFKGNISIEAEIVGEKNNFRKIEVSPYSEIGIEKKRIGLTSRPANELAGIFISLLIDSKELMKRIKPVQIQSDIEEIEWETEILYEELSYYHDNLDQATQARQELENSPDSTIYDTNSDDIEDLLTFFSLDLILMDKIYIIDIKKDLDAQINSLNNHIKNIKEKINQLESTTHTEKLPSKKTIQADLRLILDYIEYIQQGGEQAEDAFLSLIELNHIKLASIKNSLLYEFDELDKLEPSQDSSGRRSYKTILSESCKTIYVELQKLSNIDGGIIEKELKKLSDISRHNLNTTTYTDSYNYYLKFYKQNLIPIVAKRASAIIFQELHYGTIDLYKAGAKSGEVLYLYAKLYDSDRKGSGGEAKVLEIGRYELKETRWKAKTSDSFLLVDRINESSVTSTNVSPSNFKGAGGATFNITWLNNGKTGNIFNTIQPSFGINASYIDFSTDQAFEVGCSFVLGLFNNKFYVGHGVNLHLLKESERLPQFWSLGISFANLGGSSKKN